MDYHLDLTFCCLMFEAAPCMGNGSVIRFGQVHTSLGKARKMSQPGHPGILLNPHFRLLSSPLALCSFLLLQWGIPTETADWSFTQAFFKSEHQIRHGLLSGDFPSVLRQIWRAVNRVPRHCFGGCRRHLECIDFVNNGALLFSLFLRLGITAVLQLADGVPVILVMGQDKRWLRCFRFSNRVGSYRLPCMCAQSCVTLCNPIYCSPPDSSVHGIFQQRTLE